MTQKNEAPERVWIAYTDQTYQGKRGITISDEPSEGHISFIPEHHAQAELQAAVAAAYEDAASTAACECNCGPISLEAKIRARTDTDAQAALAAHDKRVREDARRVKPLEWLERRRLLEAGPYQVCCNGSPSDPDAMYRVRFHGKVICPQVKGVDRAVAWANEHHQKEILSALIEKDQTDD